MRILGIAGSLRSGSLSGQLLQLAAESTPAGVDVDEWRGLREIPPYDQDAEDPEPTAVTAFKDAIREADAVLIATPEYNGSIPGVLKNAIDWASRPDVLTGPFRNKPVAVLSSSNGMFGAVWAAADLKKVMGLVGARVVDVELAVPRAHEALAEPDDALRESVRDAVARLVAEVRPAEPARAA